MQKNDNTLQGRVLKLQSKQQSVKVNQETVPLTQQEYLLLETLAASPGKYFQGTSLCFSHGILVRLKRAP